MWQLRHWLQFLQLWTWIHDNLCYMTIKSDTGQHSQFLRCLIHSCDTFKRWTRSPRRKTQPSYFLSQWTCSGRQKHHRHLTHSRHHHLHHENPVYRFHDQQLMMLDLSRGLNETETTCGKHWLFSSKMFQLGSNWTKCFNWDRTEQDVWKGIAWLRCLNIQCLFKSRSWKEAMWMMKKRL